MQRKALTSLFLLLFALSTTGFSQQQSVPTEPVKLVDINSAPLEEIETVVLDDLLAKKIIEGRPFANKRQLLTRKLVSLEEYEKIKESDRRAAAARRSITQRCTPGW